MTSLDVDQMTPAIALSPISVILGLDKVSPVLIRRVIIRIIKTLHMIPLYLDQITPVMHPPPQSMVMGPDQEVPVLTSLRP